MQKNKLFVIIFISVVLIIISCTSGAISLFRTNNAKLTASADITNVEKDTISPTIEPTVKPTIQPSSPGNLEIKDGVDSSYDLKSWIGDYTYEEYCPPDENMFYSLSIYQKDNSYYADITISGFQTNQCLKAKVVGNDNLIDFVFDEYLPDNLFEPYMKGDILLSFKRDNSTLFTIWKEIQPMLLDTPKESICFVSINPTSSQNDKFTSTQTQASTATQAPTASQTNLQASGAAKIAADFDDTGAPYFITYDYDAYNFLVSAYENQQGPGNYSGGGALYLVNKATGEVNTKADVDLDKVDFSKYLTVYSKLSSKIIE